MRVIVAGTRNLNDDVVFEEINQTFFELACESREPGEPKGHIILSGCSGVVDLEAIRFAEINNWPCRKHYADWETHGKSAGPIRNETMAQNADTLILIWDGKSKGSADMKRRAEKHGLRIIERIVGGRMNEKPIRFSEPMIRAILDGRKTITRRPVKPQPDHSLIASKHSPTGFFDGDYMDATISPERYVTCPYGASGDRLVVEQESAVITLEITDVGVERLNSISLDDVNAEGVACSDCWTSGTPYRDFPHDDRCGCRNKFQNLWNSIYGDGAWDRNEWVWVVSFRKLD